jgi:hypothetical protein
MNMQCTPNNISCYLDSQAAAAGHLAVVVALLDRHQPVDARSGEGMRRGDTALVRVDP